MPRTGSLLRRECPNLARLVRHALNRGSLLEGPLTDRIPDSGNPGCQGQVVTLLGPISDAAVRVRDGAWRVVPTPKVERRQPIQ